MTSPEGVSRIFHTMRNTATRSDTRDGLALPRGDMRAWGAPGRAVLGIPDCQARETCFPGLWKALRRHTWGSFFLGSRVLRRSRGATCMLVPWGRGEQVPHDALFGRGISYGSALARLLLSFLQSFIILGPYARCARKPSEPGTPPGVPQPTPWLLPTLPSPGTSSQ